jgi:uncharacterized membrane protein YfcA
MNFIKKTNTYKQSKTLLAVVIGAFLSAFARDIANELPLWIKIVMISLIILTAIIIAIRLKWDNIKESRFMSFIYKHRYNIVAGIIGGVIGIILNATTKHSYSTKRG